MQSFTELYEVERRYEELAQQNVHARCGGQRRRVRADDA